ncbi:sigma-70 family RNA polymerase sigma factor [Novosphingobium album (ex Liu et al. 2023)]|uniref:Sigma-70 family RNA polymerase sigma factor n=1 Tax=Novosphingobium album (ex Liu et al. 2023) TaxID=3031130 RepID=A0ABT5WN60_9SPHN|nr:sigma-70 family RNA polymerase sigma factor [Novosphingobium album (ex Liu et al. 2023)]MDE8651161.1 sigma-70 family RNA polymerase sigma factor [Novosphingobium album (ex Liu et al. 2023)]
MKQDHTQFTPSANPQARRIAGAYTGDIADRVRRFLPMVRRLAWHVHGTGRPGIELEDLIQAGLVALTECAQRHQGPGEDGFAAYAKMRVRGAMVDLIRRTVPMSRGAVERRRQLREKEQELRGAFGRDPDSHELAEAMGIDETELANLRDASMPLRFDSIDDIYTDHDMAYAADTPDSLTLLADEELRESVAGAIAELPERLRLIVQLYFVEELNLSEIAQVLQVSIPRVHQLKAQALAKLREALEGVADII